MDMKNVSLLSLLKKEDDIAWKARYLTGLIKDYSNKFVEYDDTFYESLVSEKKTELLLCENQLTETRKLIREYFNYIQNI